MIWDILEADTFNTHFEKENLTFQELLEDQNIITEIRNLNSQLLLYIQKHQEEVFNKMVQFSTVQPSPHQSHQRKHLYPYVSSQILAIDNELIYNSFFISNQASALWERFIGFLSNKDQNNSLLFGYFIKILRNLYKGRKIQTVDTILGNDKFWTNFINHLYEESITDFVRDLFCLIEVPQETLLVLSILYQTLRKKRLIQLISFINSPNPNHQSNVNSVCQILSSIFTKYQILSSGNEIVAEMWNSPQFEKLYKIHSMSLTKLLTEIIKKSNIVLNNADEIKEYALTIPQNDKDRIKIYVEQHLKYIKDNQSNVQQFIKNQNKVKVRKSNPKIINFCDLLLEILKSNINLQIQTVQNLANYLSNFILTHPFNDILLGKICNIYIEIGKKHIIIMVNVIVHLILQITPTEIKSRVKDLKIQRQHIYGIWKVLKMNEKYNLVISNILGEIKFDIQNWNSITKQLFGQLQQSENIKWGTTLKQPIFMTKMVIDEQDISTLLQENKKQNTEKTQVQSTISFQAFNNLSFD